MPKQQANAKTADQTEKIAQGAIEEARIVLPGIQALFEFQLIAAFNDRFRDLSELEQGIHFAALVLITVSIALIMTPAAYHRLAEQSTVSQFFIHLTSWLIATAMVPLMFKIVFEVYLLGEIIFAWPLASAAIAAGLLVLFAGLWFGFPLAVRRTSKGK